MRGSSHRQQRPRRDDEGGRGALIGIKDEEAFGRRLVESSRNRVVYEIAPKDAADLERSCDALASRWWGRAEERCLRMTPPVHLVADTKWYADFAARCQMRKTADVQKVVGGTCAARVVRKLMAAARGGGSAKPVRSFPAMEVYIDDVTHRGLVSVLPLLPGTIVGHFMGTVTQNRVGAGYKFKSDLRGRYSMFSEYAGSTYVIDPVRREYDDGSTPPDVMPSGLVNEPRTHGKSMHGSTSKQSLRSGETYKWSKDGKHYDVQGLEWHAGRPHAVHYLDPSSRRGVVRKRHIPLDELDIPHAVRSKLVANLVCAPIELPLCFYRAGPREGGESSAYVVYDLREGAFCADQCVKLSEVRRMCDRLIRTKRTRGKGVEEDTQQIYASTQIEDYDVLFLKPDVFPLCRRAVQVLPLDRSRTLLDAHDSGALVRWAAKMIHVASLKAQMASARTDKDRRAVRQKCAKRAKERDGLDIGDDAIEAYEEEKLGEAATGKGGGTEIVLLRFFRTHDSWNCAKRQPCYRMPDGRDVPFPPFRTGNLGVRPGEELLFHYTHRDFAGRGLKGDLSVDRADCGPCWRETPPARKNF